MTEKHDVFMLPKMQKHFSAEKLLALRKKIKAIEGRYDLIISLYYSKDEPQGKTQMSMLQE